MPIPRALQKPRISLLLAPLTVVAASAACFPGPPDLDPAAEPTPDLGTLPSPWDTLSEPHTVPEPTTSGTTSDATSGVTSGPSGDSGATSGGPTGEAGGDPPPDLRDLRLTEVLADPEGKDGGADSPELVELQNLGEDTLPLTDLTILARGWPRLSASKLGLAEEHLGPGEILLLRRYSGLDEAPWVGILREGGVLEARFTTSDGLRNKDGAVILLGPEDQALDAVIYGGDPPPSHSFPGAWEGPPVDPPVSGLSFCRIDPAIDSDQAVDWDYCLPSPGEVAPLDHDDMEVEDDSDSDGEGESDTDTEPVDAAVVIVEVLSNAPGPSAKEYELEYVEIINLGPDDLDLAGYTIADSLDINAPGRDLLLYREGDGGCAPATCLAAGARALIVGGGYIGPTNGALVFETDDLQIAHKGLTAHETVVLRDPMEMIVTTYRDWEDLYAAPYPFTVEEPLHRETPEAIDIPANWDFGDPSPGLP